ncbi:hypothetical protein P8452_71127 [Trifolium repens]|nr:hypothetical protein P8452_71127 [Trifolium repens]
MLTDMLKSWWLFLVPSSVPLVFVFGISISVTEPFFNRVHFCLHTTTISPLPSTSPFTTLRSIFSNQVSVS